MELARVLGCSDAAADDLSSSRQERLDWLIIEPTPSTGDEGNGMKFCEEKAEQVVGMNDEREPFVQTFASETVHVGADFLEASDGRELRGIFVELANATRGPDIVQTGNLLRA